MEFHAKPKDLNVPIDWRDVPPPLRIEKDGRVKVVPFDVGRLAQPVQRAVEKEDCDIVVQKVTLGPIIKKGEMRK